MRSHFEVGDRILGEGQPPFVIAEIGVNHDGSVERAIELVRHAKAAGADAVKLQLFKASRLVHPSATVAAYQTANCGATDQASMLRTYELSVTDVARVVDAARVVGLVPIATPFSTEDLFVIEQLKLPLIKIASPDLVNKPLLHRATRSGTPILVSTGASTIEEIETCVTWLRGWGAAFGLMHCVSAYPTPPDEAKLAWIDDLRRRYSVPIGYSDHTTEPIAGALAVASGACVIEKHLTWNRFANGPDHSASADPRQFAVYVAGVRSAARLRGVGSREVLPAEADVRRLSRQSLITARPIAAGQRIGREDLIAQRPGNGILARELDRVAGKPATRDLPAGTILAWDMIADAA